MFSTAEEAKKNNWFSRRNETSDANQSSSEVARQKKTRKRIQAQERSEARAKLNNQEQLSVLEARGVTSGREVDRLRG